MDQKSNNTDNWVESAADLVEAYRQLIAVKIVEHTSLGASISIVGLLSLILTVFILLFTGLGSAWWLGEYLNDMKTGFFIIGGVYTLLFGVLLVTRKLWTQRIRNLIIKMIYDQD